MANPQLENGHIKIATEIFDHLCAFRFPGEARQVLDAVIRKTYGWNKKSDMISLAQFSELTGLGKPNICRALAVLAAHNIINHDNGQYSLQKDIERWIPFEYKQGGRKLSTTIKPLSATITPPVINHDNAIISHDNESLSATIMTVISHDNALHINQKTLSKDNTKDTITKDNGAKAPFNPFDCCHAFSDYRNLMDGYSNQVAFLIGAFNSIHRDAPASDFEDIGGRLGKLWATNNRDTGFILKVMWDISTAAIAGSHIDFLHKALEVRKTKAPGHKPNTDPDKFLKGKYAHMVQR